MSPLIRTYSTLLELEIRKLKFGKTPPTLYEPIRYIMTLGGKRLRPLLTLLSYSLFKENVKDVIPYAIAVETFHNFTLMHDDIMDQAPKRRGQSTVHKKWNLSTAILSGDVMLVKVYETFSELDPEKFKRVIKAFNTCATQVCEGQQWDMEFENLKTVTEAQYINMIKLKTAVLLGFSLELGAILANEDDTKRRALREFGINIGVGFQLKDDLLDAYGDPKKFGKQPGGDIVANKKTFMLIKALERAQGKQKASLEKWLGAEKFNGKEKVKAIKHIYDNLNIPVLAEKKVNYYFNQGFGELEKLECRKEGKEGLKSFAEKLIQREL